MVQKTLGFLIFALLFLLFPQPSHAIHTAASFDASYAITGLSVETKRSSSTIVNKGTLESRSGYEIDYNVSLFDFKTLVTLSFAQFINSNIGETPLTRLALGASYHFLRMNGERLVLDNQVESKTWGISPAIEMSLGLTSFSPHDGQSNTGVGDFTASLFDMSPRFLVEVPVNPTFLILFRAGYLKSLSLLSNTAFTISYSGYVFLLGVKLTTL